MSWVIRTNKYDKLKISCPLKIKAKPGYQPTWSSILVGVLCQKVDLKHRNLPMGLLQCCLPPSLPSTLF